jgi:hypothetical protein
MKENKEYLATNVLHLMKRSLKRMYGLLIIFIILFVISVVDSVYQRCRIIDLLEQYEVVEETVTETYDMDTENRNNNYVGGDNNGEIENN